MKTNIIDVYLTEDHFNPVCNTTIPGAWVAVVENDYLGEFSQPFARPHEFFNVDDARAHAETLFS